MSHKPIVHNGVTYVVTRNTKTVAGKKRVLYRLYEPGTWETHYHITYFYNGPVAPTYGRIGTAKRDHGRAGASDEVVALARLLVPKVYPEAAKHELHMGDTKQDCDAWIEKG